jgi:mRNA-degrading endonuclease toxin of MazEF toxin-antitoxin module
MTECKRGDCVLVNALLPGSEEPVLRPALVVSSETYGMARNQLIVAAITANLKPLRPGDTVIAGWREAGLLAPSVVTGVVITISSDSVARLLGSLTASDQKSADASLNLSLGL